MKQFTKREVEEAYEQHGTVAATARALGCAPQTFTAWARRYGVVLRPVGRPKGPAATTCFQTLYEQYGTVAAAATAIGVPKATFYKMAHEHGVVLRPVGSRGKQCVLYGLFDPRDGAMRYIGVSGDVQARYQEHLRDGEEQKRSYKARWIMQLFALKLMPECRVLVVLESAKEAKRIETALIAAHRRRGADITNGTLGGDGVVLTPELLARRVESQRAFYRTLEGEQERERKRAVGREAKAKQVYSAASREKMRMAKIGKPQMARTPEWAAKISAAQKGKARRPWTDAERARHESGMNREQMSASAKARWQRAQEQAVLATVAPEWRADVAALRICAPIP